MTARLSSPPLRQVQASLSGLPEHVLRVDLLAFRRREIEAPSPWDQLVAWCAPLLEAVLALRPFPDGEPRAPGAQSPPTAAGAPPPATGSGLRGSSDGRHPRGGPTIPVATVHDPPAYHLGRSRLDELGEDQLTEAQAWAAERAGEARGHPAAAREQLAMLLEERLYDVLLEAAHALRRRRRYPRLPPDRNPCLPLVHRAHGRLRAEVQDELERLARAMGPIAAAPLEPQPSY